MNEKGFEELIISFIQGNSLPNYANVIDQMLQQEENLHSFMVSLFNLFFITKNEIARKSSMVFLTFLLTKKSLRDIFDENYIQEIISKLITFYQNYDFLLHDKDQSANVPNIETNNNEMINNEMINNEMIYLFTQLVGTIAQNIQQYSIINKFVDNSEVNKKRGSGSVPNIEYLKDLTFQITTIYALFTTINFSNIESYYKIILDILKRALESYDQNFDNAIKSIYILASLLDFYPDEKESTKDHIDIIITIANNSEKLPPNLFLNLWKSICRFLHSEGASNDKELVSKFHPSVFKVCLLSSIPSEFKLYPLRSIWSCSCDYDRPIIHQISQLTVKIASEYVTQSRLLPFDFLFIFETCFHDFEHDMVYQFSRQLIIACLSSENPSDRIVGLCLISYMVHHVPHEVFHDTESVIDAVEKGLQSEDILAIEASSIIISSCSPSISSNLIDTDSLLQKFIPFVIHPHPDVRFHSTQACLSLLSFSKPQIPPAISLMVFNLITKVPMEDMFRFLSFLSKCISHDVQLEKELAIHFANFTLSMMSIDSNANKYNQSIIAGSCYVSIALMGINENTHQILLPRTMEIISSTLQSDIQYIKNFGISMLNKFMKLFPNEGSKLFKMYSKTIESVLDMDNNDDSVNRRKAIIDISSIVSLNDDSNHPFIPKIIEIGMKWLNSGQQILIGSGVQTLKKLQCHPILPKDIIVQIFQEIASILTQTKSFDVACSCAYALAYCVRHCTASAEARDEIAKIGYHLGIEYIKGEMLVLQGISPIGTDLEFHLIYSMSMFVCELFSTPSNLMRYFFPFIESVINRKNNLNTEVMMICLVNAIKNNALIEEEVIKTKNIMLSLFIDQIPQELMCTEVKLITVMLDKNFITLDEFNDDRINTLRIWWNFCQKPHSRTKLKTASSALALLFWKLQATYKIRPKIEDLIIMSFKQFPPEDITYTPDTVSVIEICIENDTDPPEIIILNTAKGVMKIMLLSKMTLKKRGIDDELFDKCKNILAIALRRSPKVQQMINEFASKSESRKLIFREFIH